MSPEQWNSEEIDPRTDVWAVGIILHELATGRHPLDPLSKKRLEPVADLDIPMPQARDKYPQLGQLGAIIDRCLAKRKHERFDSAAALLEQLELLLVDRDAIESDEEQNPFAGLAPFQEADAARFFGRTHEVARLISHLHQHQFVTVTGTSGVGKSSFVRAGVIPALKRLGEGWEVCIVRPGRHPLETLAAAAVTSTGMPALTRTKQLVDTWREQPGHLGALLRERCRQRTGRMLLFVDQFDELYNADIEQDERDTFIACLEGVADDQSSPLRVILALRSDRLDRIAGDPEFMAQVTRGMMFLSPMTRDNVRDALTGPLERVDYRFETAELVEESEEPAPPPAPSRPPPAPEPEPRAVVSAGPPPPPVSGSAVEAAMAALPTAPPVDEGWQVDMFGEHYAALLPVQRPTIVSSEVDFIVHCAGLVAGASVLDVGCGDGAHAVAMAARGLAVTALDPAPAQLMRASQNAQAMGLSVNLVSGDMRQPPLEGQFDTIVCLGGTLGMFSDEDDRLAMQHMRDRLAPGGRLMLHVLNREYIVNRLPARSWWQGQGCLVLDEAQMFAPTSRLHVHRTVVFETGSQFEHNIALRVYGLTDLVHLCAQVGLQVLEYSGSRHTRGRIYGATSPEIWLLAQRPMG